jgi:sarcosine oxidase
MDCSEAKVLPTDRVLTMTGGLMLGLPDSQLIQGTLTSAREHSLPHEVLAADEVHRRFPAFCPQPEEIGVLDPEAGYLVPELCNFAHIRLSAMNGANLHFEEPVTHWRVLSAEEALGVTGVREAASSSSSSPCLVQLTTPKGEYYARKLVLTVGAWAPLVYSDSLGLGLHVQRRQLCWFRPPSEDDAHCDPMDAFKVEEPQSRTL